MLKWKRSVALAALMASATSAACATEGWYGRIDAGYTGDANLDVEPLTTGAGVFGGDVGFDESAVVMAGIGYAFANGLRLEGEVTHAPPVRRIDAVIYSGSVQATALMANLYFDFNGDGGIRLYFGAGIGIARMDAELADAAGVASFDDDSTGAAYQAMVGVAFSISERLDLDIGYRRFAVPDVSFDGVALSPSAAAREFDADYAHQSITLGLRWGFAGAAPPRR